MRFRVFADQPLASDLLQGNFSLRPVLNAARVAVIEVAGCLRREAPERGAALSLLSRAHHHKMLDQSGHGRGILPSLSRSLLKRLAQLWLTGQPSKRDQAVADLARQRHALGAGGR